MPPKSTERELADIDIGALTGPTVRSHPFEEMLVGKNPSVSQLAEAVPENFYYIRFRSPGKLLELADSSDLWATHLFSQSTQDATSLQVSQRIQTQLCVETNPLLRPFYDLAVHEVAVTGSDLFLREGSDVTLLFRYEQEAVFKAQMDHFLASAAEAHLETRQTTETYRGVALVHLATPDRKVSVYSAYPQKGLHVRSNSRVAFERIIDTLIGPNSDDAKSIGSKSLSEALDFRYVRTLYEMGAEEEDGFIYLSDAFIRELVGPVKKITQRRRLLCYNHLRMLGHAAMLYQTEYGTAPATVEKLIQSKCLTEGFGPGRLVCPDHGQYKVTDGGTVGSCSVHGRAERMTPCCDIQVKRITATEQTLYRRFLEEYNRYWRTFFDPIGIRVKANSQNYRLETIVLPLIDNSIYTSMARVLGGPPRPLDTLSVPKRVIFSVALKLDKDILVAADANRQVQASSNQLRQIVLGLLNYESAYQRFPPRDEKGANLSWRVHILPYLEQGALYRRFKLDEPWDSPHNKLLLKEMPKIYGPEGTATRFVGFSGEGAPFGKRQGLGIGDIRDGISKTICVVEAGAERAVPWTKPADLPFDPSNPAAVLGEVPEGGLKVAFMDGSISTLPKDVDADRLKALITYQGGESVTRPPFQPRRRQPRALINPAQIEGVLHQFGATREDTQTLAITEFLTDGIGEVISFHIYDAEPTVAFSASQFVGQMMGGWGGRFDNEMLFAIPLISSLNSPVYLAIPVKNEQIVDQFLEKLDRVLAKVARKPFGGGFFSVETDFYHLPAVGDDVRCFAWELFSFRFRFFVARIDQNLYIATQPCVVADLIEQAAAGSKKNLDSSRDSTAHALVRIRPENWNLVLADYRLGWAESNRASCLKNIGPLTGVARAYSGTGDSMVDVAKVLYGVSYYCLEGGQYEVHSTDGSRAASPCSVHCTVHGTAAVPLQAVTPTKDSQLDRLLSDFTGLTAALTFTEDGLRAVLQIDKTPSGP